MFRYIQFYFNNSLLERGLIMPGRLAIYRKRKEIGRKLTGEELFQLFQDNLSIRCHVLSYWQEHLLVDWVDVPEEFPVSFIVKMLLVSFTDNEAGIDAHFRTNHSVLERLWKLFRKTVDSVLTRRDLLKDYPGLLQIELGYQNIILSDDKKQAIRLFNRLSNNQISKGEIVKKAKFIIDYAPDNDIKNATRIILREQNIEI